MNHEMDGMSHGHEMESSAGMDMGMKMYFHFGLGDQLLFQKLIIDSNFKLWITCLVLFALAIFLESIKYLRGLKCQCELKPFHMNPANNHDHVSYHETEVRLCCSGRGGSGAAHCQLGLFRYQNKTYRLAQAILQLIYSSLSFTLMLAAMTFNICMIFAIVLGTSVGSYFFQRSPNGETLCH